MFFRKASGDELRDDFLVVRAGLQELVIGVYVIRFLFDSGEEFLERFLILVLDQIWFGDDRGTVFEIYKAMRTIEAELDLLRIHEMEERDVVLSIAQVLKSFSQKCGFDEEVRQNHNEGSLLDFFSHLVKGVNQAGFTFWLDMLQGIKNVLKLGWSAAGRDLEVKLLAAARKPYGVSLINDEIGESGCYTPGELDFGGVFGRGKVH